MSSYFVRSVVASHYNTNTKISNLIMKNSVTQDPGEAMSSTKMPAQVKIVGFTTWVTLASPPLHYPGDTRCT